MQGVPGRAAARVGRFVDQHGRERDRLGAKIPEEGAQVARDAGVARVAHQHAVSLDARDLVDGGRRRLAAPAFDEADVSHHLGARCEGEVPRAHASEVPLVVFQLFQREVVPHYQVPIHLEERALGRGQRVRARIGCPGEHKAVWAGSAKLLAGLLIKIVWQKWWVRSGQSGLKVAVHAVSPPASVHQYVESSPQTRRECGN